jgi:hypothetical protein
MKKTIIIFAALAVLPAVALAQDFRYVDQVVGRGQYYLGVAVTVLMILMTLWFLWTVFKFIGTKDSKERVERRKQMIAGLIGLFIAVGVWGIIRIATKVSGVNTDESFNITCPPGYRYDRILQACVVR